MEIFLTLVALVVVVSGILSANLSSRTEEVFTQQELESNATPTPTKFPTSTPTPSPKILEDKVIEFKYPNSKIVSSSENSFEAQSSDPADLITNWYKNKIEALGMGVKAFVTTETNGNILNKLGGADGDHEVSIEIKKQASEARVLIIVSVK